MNERRSRTAGNATTIREVAERAGVSVSTVSKALNDTGSLSPATREKVLKVARELRFRPNVLAKSLHTGQSGSIGLISNDSFGRFTMPIMEGLEHALSSSGVGVFLCNATDDPERERAHIEQLLAKQVDGLVLTARRADRRPAVDLEGIGIPVIYVFSSSDDPDALTLLPDDEGGARMAVEHLISGGRRRIAHVTGPERFEAVRLRHRGYLDALNEASLTTLPVLYGEWSERWGREAVATLLDNPSDQPDAIFCGNDQIARGCADALREAGRRVPDDVALVGFDNWAVITDACRPPLSSVDMQLQTLGAEAADRLLAMMRGEPQAGVIRLPCRLVIRESSAAKSAPDDGIAN